MINVESLMTKRMKGKIGERNSSRNDFPGKKDRRVSARDMLVTTLSRNQIQRVCPTF